MLSLNQKFKKAYKDFKIYQNFFTQIQNPNKPTLKFLIENKDFFIKNYAVLENLLKECQNYEALKETLVINISFVLRHLKAVSAWINSKEFKEKYEGQSHPYPPLLDPEILNALLDFELDEFESLKDERLISYAKEGLDYRLINAQEAWDMNLPLPRRYKYALFTFGLSSHFTIIDFFAKTFNLTFNCVVGWQNDFYLLNFYSTEKKDIVSFSMHYIKTKLNIKSICLSSHLSFIIVVRDPISRLKTGINHGWYKDGYENASFHLNDNIDEVLDRRRFHNGISCEELYPNLGVLSLLLDFAKDANFAYNTIATLCKKKVHYIDTSEINPSEVMDSMRKYAKFFGKNLDEKHLTSLENYLKEKQFSIFAFIIPLSLEINTLKIKICLKNQRNGFNDYTKELINHSSKTLDIIALAMSEEDFKALKGDEKLLHQTKEYLSEFARKLEILRQNYVRTYAKEENVLEYLKNNPQLAWDFYQVCQKELKHIKQERPDIIASWKYYNEFEKICEGFKTSIV